MGRARQRAAGKARPRVLFSVMRSYEGSGRITEITAVGRDGFFNQLLETAGGENVYQGPLPFPTITREAILTLNPQIIVDLVRDGGGEAAMEDWLSLGPSVDAVRDGRVVIFTEESDNVPGPRIHMTITRLSEALFPPDPPARAPAGASRHDLGQDA
jgi:ABC-type Fe3+-hydroxamate transport system substrate-binding protein